MPNEINTNQFLTIYFHLKYAHPLVAVRLSHAWYLYRHSRTPNRCVRVRTLAIAHTLLRVHAHMCMLARAYSVRAPDRQAIARVQSGDGLSLAGMCGAVDFVNSEQFQFPRRLSCRSIFRRCSPRRPPTSVRACACVYRQICMWDSAN